MVYTVWHVTSKTCYLIFSAVINGAAIVWLCSQVRDDACSGSWRSSGLDTDAVAGGWGRAAYYKGYIFEMPHFSESASADYNAQVLCCRMRMRAIYQWPLDGNSYTDLNCLVLCKRLFSPQPRWFICSRNNLRIPAILHFFVLLFLKGDTASMRADFLFCIFFFIPVSHLSYWSHN